MPATGWENRRMEGPLCLASHTPCPPKTSFKEDKWNTQPEVAPHWGLSTKSNTPPHHENNSTAKSTV